MEKEDEYQANKTEEEKKFIKKFGKPIIKEKVI